MAKHAGGPAKKPREARPPVWDWGEMQQWRSGVVSLNFQTAPALPLSLEEHGRVVTVRVGRELHVTLHSEAHLAKTSLNQFCISKLIAGIPSYPIVPGNSRKDLEEFIQLRDAWLATLANQRGGVSHVQ